MEDLADYITIQDAVEDNGEIYAKVLKLKRPFSELEDIFSPKKEWLIHTF